MNKKLDKKFEEEFDKNLGGWNLPNTQYIGETPEGLTSTMLPSSRNVKKFLKAFIDEHFVEKGEEEEKMYSPKEILEIIGEDEDVYVIDQKDATSEQYLYNKDGVVARGDSDCLSFIYLEYIKLHQAKAEARERLNK